jgi:hypothetical protein
MTFKTVTANPKFDKTKQFNFKKYFYEPFTGTLKRYYSDDSS